MVAAGLNFRAKAVNYALLAFLNDGLLSKQVQDRVFKNVAQIDRNHRTFNI